jgi:hypothetical protein
MATHGAALQSQNNELVKCIEDLKEKREMLTRSIREDEAEKSKIQQDLQVWSSKATLAHTMIGRHVAIRQFICEDSLVLPEELECRPSQGACLRSTKLSAKSTKRDQTMTKLFRRLKRRTARSWNHRIHC